jgi:hypothetical protein
MANFDKVEEVIGEARGIAWDTCHKIYVLMDDEQMALMKTYGYDPLISADEMSADEMLETLKKWFDESCGLRFINAVRTNPDDPNEGFTDLIGQFENEDECEECGAELGNYDKVWYEGGYYCLGCQPEDEDEDDEDTES